MVDELKRARMGVKIDGKWCGTLHYMNDIALADTGVEFQDMLDVEQDYVING